MTKSKNILVAPLNWGLGHATRCIPVINTLLIAGFTPILASDNEALALLRKEFPDLTSIQLPSYKIRYAKKGWLFKWRMLLNMPYVISAVLKEQQQIKKIAAQFELAGIISDNRLGIYHTDIPSVYISHQLTVLSGNSTNLTSRFHQKIISKFDECWVPDITGDNSFSGDLACSKSNLPNVTHIGILSRFKKLEKTIIYDYLILLSGPEPQRSLLETKLLHEFQNTSKQVLFIQGKVEHKQSIKTTNHMTTYNFMTSHQLEEAINKSTVVISRSGYTTIMDLALIGKKAFFIPTPGQYEQLYLAKRMKELHYAPFATQEQFSLKNLDELKDYEGLYNSSKPTDFKTLFRIFD
jgi:uncharacterized protein (TIGR00661 family)